MVKKVNHPKMAELFRSVMFFIYVPRYFRHFPEYVSGCVMYVHMSQWHVCPQSQADERIAKKPLGDFEDPPIFHDFSASKRWRDE